MRVCRCIAPAAVSNLCLLSLLSDCKADSLLFRVPNGVILPQKRIAKDPNWDTSVHTFNSKLALLDPFIVLSTNDIERRLEHEVMAVKGEGNVRQSVHIRAIRRNVADWCNELIYVRWRACQHRGASINNHIAARQEVAL